MSEPLLAVTRLEAAYGPVVALRGLDFTVDEGEIVVILGANGAGKTTTMRAVCGTVATTGSIELRGREIVGRRPDRIARLGIAHVPQGRGTFAELSVEDNLAAGAYQRRDRAAVRAEIDDWYATFPVLGQRRDQPAGHLSGGEQQMLAIARALLGHPCLLLLDEPSLGLAPLVVRELFALLATRNRDEGLAMLLVEQNANLALDIAHRGYVLETGEIRASGPADALRADDTVRRAYLGLGAS
jgi:branched-chain amino acid transport system ATP-binding protein